MDQIEILYKQLISAVPSFRHSFEDFAHFFYLVCSRDFGIAEYDKDMSFLIPYADMANAGTAKEANTTWEYESITHSFTLVATSAIKKNQPVIN